MTTITIHCVGVQLTDDFRVKFTATDTLAPILGKRYELAYVPDHIALVMIIYIALIESAAITISQQADPNSNFFGGIPL